MLIVEGYRDFRVAEKPNTRSLQVASYEELLPGKVYTVYYRPSEIVFTHPYIIAGKERANRIQILEAPRIESTGRGLVRVLATLKLSIHHPLPYAIDYSLSALGLMPDEDGMWHQYEWLEDPSKI